MPGAEEKLWPVAWGTKGLWGPLEKLFLSPLQKKLFFVFSYRSMFSFGKSAEMRSNDLKAVEWSWKFVKLHLWNYNYCFHQTRLEVSACKFPINLIQ